MTPARAAGPSRRAPLLLAPILALVAACSGDGVTAPPLTLTTTVLPAARATLPYAATLAASGGAGDYSYVVTSGELPTGIMLASDGTLSGRPSTAGVFPLGLQVRDHLGRRASGELTLRVCELPGLPSVGEVRMQSPGAPGSCGIFLPSGPGGTLYRVALVRTSHAPDPQDVRTVTLQVRGNGVEAAPRAASVETTSPAAATLPRIRRVPRAYVAQLEATARLHARQLSEGQALVRRLGSSAVLPGPGSARAPAAPLPPRLELDPHAEPSCAAAPRRVAFKVAEDDRLAVYQDSAQNAVDSTKATPEQAQLVLRLYRDHGKPVIDGYFGGVPDLDGNGRVVVLVTPAVGDALGATFPGDLLTRGACPASNEGEYVYLSSLAFTSFKDADPAPGLGFYALVHELKHVSSLHQRILRSRDVGGAPTFHALWMEEGGAELAAERAARLAWARGGGPALTELVRGSDLAGSDPTPSNVALPFMLLGTQRYLSVQPNSVVTHPPGEDPGYTYGSGWLFLRWLGDVYGGAGGAALADSALFRALHDKGVESDVRGVERITGRTWAQLMAEYAAAVLANGQVPYGKGFSSYDFVTAVEVWCFARGPEDLPDPDCEDESFAPGPPGAFPWPVTLDASGNGAARPLDDALFTGPAGPSGIRVHDFLSNGTGHGAELNAEAADPSLLMVVRLR